ncbi:Protein of unknown function [Rhodoferax sp. OV413]|uniref:DUF3237 domain-containing protein n=1 Tax=Rhodoferax sp. OV413 TaxID=1855285 RepID=UPI0008859DD5|nr:DUF3237 domain-containing protein [Rhodoferax sp. OV413]SDP61049.1 Protein of unknown function [Rhodoferax sp. OV413]
MDIQLQFLFVFKGTGRPIIHEMGPGPLGNRRLVALDDQATFEGPRLRGTLLPGGIDLQLTRLDGVTEIDANYLLRTDDGVLLKVTNMGIRHTQSRTVELGQTELPHENYFRCTPKIEAPSGRYDWLNRSIYIGTGIRSKDGIELWFYRVL